MAVSDSEIEALTARKWPEAIMGDEREREREFYTMKKKGAFVFWCSMSLLPTDFLSVII